MIGRYLCLVAGIIVATACPRLAEAQSLTAADVNTIIGRAVAAAAKLRTPCTVAVSDREGYMLGVYSRGNAPFLSKVNAMAKAGTAAYLSSNQDAFTSRTAGYIIQPHFPPGIRNTAPGPLTGVGLSSLPFSDVNHFRGVLNENAGIPNLTLSGNPGGLPLYKDGKLVGGVGVDSNAVLSALIYVAAASKDENIAACGQTGYVPPTGILATTVLVNGFRLPYSSAKATPVVPTNLPEPAVGAVPAGAFDPAFPPLDSPGHPHNPLFANPFPNIPAGEVRNQIMGSPLPAINGQPRLTAAEVTQILRQAAVRAAQTRGAIRSPSGVPAQVFIVVVDYYNPGTPPGTVTPPVASNPPTVVPQVLGSFRTPDATLFSYDVAAQKARTALFFSNNTMAMSSRSVGFLAQGTYPPGIDGTAPGPYGPPSYGASNATFLTVPTAPIFNPKYGLQVLFTFNPVALKNVTPGPTPEPKTMAVSATQPPNAFLPNGITVFPGGFPLYRNGQLIGAIGISGDGVDQDDIISASGTVGFEAPQAIRADQFTYRNARLPYAKFPQNSSL